MRNLDLGGSDKAGNKYNSFLKAMDQQKPDIDRFVQVFKLGQFGSLEEYYLDFRARTHPGELNYKSKLKNEGDESKIQEIFRISSKAIQFRYVIRFSKSFQVCLFQTYNLDVEAYIKFISKS